jgi:hypothetical protein
MSTEHPKSTVVLTKLQIILAGLMLAGALGSLVHTWWQTSTNAELAADRTAEMRTVLLQHGGTISEMNRTLGAVDQRTQDIEKYFLRKTEVGN